MCMTLGIPVLSSMSGAQMCHDFLRFPYNDIFYKCSFHCWHHRMFKSITEHERQRNSSQQIDVLYCGYLHARAYKWSGSSHQIRKTYMYSSAACCHRISVIWMALFTHNNTTHYTRITNMDRTNSKQFHIRTGRNNFRWLTHHKAHARTHTRNYLWAVKHLHTAPCRPRWMCMTSAIFARVAATATTAMTHLAHIYRYDSKHLMSELRNINSYCAFRTYFTPNLNALYMNNCYPSWEIGIKSIFVIFWIIYYAGAFSNIFCLSAGAKCLCWSNDFYRKVSNWTGIWPQTKRKDMKWSKY